ncbi:MAG TPA: hypothetical protein VFE73_07290 [Reyranella sp.]|jgi:hypothetical protein|nr:hypothetical protein [Reyranella sp.]
MTRYCVFALLAALPSTAFAQTDDTAYCNKLSALASRYIGSAGAEGRIAPDLNVLGATQDCNKGRTATAIPYLEKRLRDNHITVPPR